MSRRLVAQDDRRARYRDQLDGGGHAEPIGQDFDAPSFERRLDRLLRPSIAQLAGVDRQRDVGSRERRDALGRPVPVFGEESIGRFVGERGSKGGGVDVTIEPPQGRDDDLGRLGTRIGGEPQREEPMQRTPPTISGRKSCTRTTFPAPSA